MKRVAYFAGGCFWCITPVFKVYGATDVVSGYSGGSEVNPTYEDVKHQKTGHRESIAVYYDDEQVDYQALLNIFMKNVDPFDDEGQYVDRGHSYTLAIYYQTQEEMSCAVRAIKELEASSGKKVYIAVEPFQSFYAAEEYHQDFYQKNPEEFEQELKVSGRKALTE